MCSISGEVSYKRNLKEDKNIFINMQKTLIRRGPDSNGITLNEHSSLIHTRLSVIDLENGA